MNDIFRSILLFQTTRSSEWIAVITEDKDVLNQGWKWCWSHRRGQTINLQLWLDMPWARSVKLCTQNKPAAVVCMSVWLHVYVCMRERESHPLSTTNPVTLEIVVMDQDWDKGAFILFHVAEILTDWMEGQMPGWMDGWKLASCTCRALFFLVVIMWLIVEDICWSNAVTSICQWKNQQMTECDVV